MNNLKKVQHVARMLVNKDHFTFQTKETKEMHFRQGFRKCIRMYFIFVRLKSTSPETKEYFYFVGH